MQFRNINSLKLNFQPSIYNDLFVVHQVPISDARSCKEKECWNVYANSAYNAVVTVWPLYEAEIVMACWKGSIQFFSQPKFSSYYHLSRSILGYSALKVPLNLTCSCRTGAVESSVDGHSLVKRKALRRHKAAILRAARGDQVREKLARTNELQVPVDQISREWMERRGRLQVQNLAEFYGIYRDLCRNKPFKAQSLIHGKYGSDHVYYGNFLKPEQCQEAPEITFQPTGAKFHSCLFLNLDGNLFENDKEVLHWFVANIEGSSVSEGEVVVPYIPPLPWKGSGYHRFCLLLLAHSSKVDCSQFKGNSGLAMLTSSFDTYDFLSRNPSLSAAGVAWFQAQWDESVGAYCREKLGFSEPIFELEEFIHPKEREAIRRKKEKAMIYRNM